MTGCAQLMATGTASTTRATVAAAAAAKACVDVWRYVYAVVVSTMVGICSKGIKPAPAAC